MLTILCTRKCQYVKLLFISTDSDESQNGNEFSNQIKLNVCHWNKNATNWIQNCLPSSILLLRLLVFHSADDAVDLNCFLLITKLKKNLLTKKPGKNRYKINCNHKNVYRMSMFFFRLHNLQRAEESKRKKRAERQRQQQRHRRGAKVFRCVSDSAGHLTLAPSRLFEKTPMSPSDSLDEIALQIPR